jgi:plastocyanin
MKRSFLLAALLLVTNGASPPPYKVVPVPNGGSIVGKITYGGPHVERKEIMPTVDAPVCGKHGLIESDQLVISKSGGIEWAVVRLTDIKSGRPASDIPKTVLEQKGCMFEPHVFAVATGTPVEEQNADGILHNVHTHSTKNPSVNFAHPPSKLEMELSTFTAPESIKVTCDVHSWMSAWIWVSSNPYIAVTGPDGSYKITGVPPGQYHVEIWQESLGKTTREVTVTPGKETTLDVSLPVPAPHAAASGNK